MKTYSDAQIADLIEVEGTEYTLRNFLNPEQIEDEITRRMCAEAVNLLDKLERRLFAARAVEEDGY